MRNNKKSSLFQILKILEKYSDENHYLTHEQISFLLQKKEFGSIKLRRKAVGKNIKILYELGYDINSKQKIGTALLDRQFNINEARFIADAVYGSPAISTKRAKDIIDKLQSGFSTYQKVDYGRLNKNDDLVRTEEDVLFNVEILAEAIKKRKRIKFHSVSYNMKGERVINPRTRRLNPYYLINNAGRYYVLGSPWDNHMQAYRIDRMADIEIPEDQRDHPYKSIKEIGGHDDFKLNKYLREHIYLIGDTDKNKVVETKLECLTGKAVRDIMEFFGKSAKLTQKGDHTYMSFKCEEKTLASWLTTYGKDIKVIEPQSIIDKMRELAQEILNKYSD